VKFLKNDKVICFLNSEFFSFSDTLASEIDIGQEINVGPGTFGKKNKH
jgi:hypothetical protein